ncbi:MAG: ABC transporter substrate-binding protein, partial [Rhodospirillales bacterium]|nr:ABC transporter substrate-binding protein [Rhodospirillales bacterium]
MKAISAAIAGGLAATLISGAATAENLTIGVSQETTSAYPNYWVTTPNQQIAAHMFNNLVEMNHQNRPTPGLAESWKPVDDKTWEFKLRKGVKFHDRTPFTADHIITTFDHAKGIEGVGAAS